ncbi:MAG: hypothetical protein EPO10_04685 [Reyranella sp.]|nr:MAG: hypothetical protein EPO10_04685 [Reyranella sp.]
MADREVAAAVWGETSQVTPKDGADATLTRLYAVAGQLAGTAKKRGLDGKLRKLQPPRIGSPEAEHYQKMIAIVDAVEGGTWSGVALPLRAALWEVTITGSPRLGPPLPRAVDWITQQDVTSGGDFVVGDGSDGRIYRLFETAKAPADDELPFASAITGSGLPEPRGVNPYSGMAWMIGIIAAVVFVAGGAMSVWTGNSMSNARNLLLTNNPLLQYEMLAAVTEACAADYKAFPNGQQSTLCSKVLKANAVPPKTGDRYEWPDVEKAKSVLADAKACPAKPSQDGCNTIWRAAIQVDQMHSWKAGIFNLLDGASAYLTGVRSAAGSVSILVPFLMLVCGIAGVTVALGLGTKQRVAGVWIDTRNRMSLARAQVTLWTIVALAGYGVFALFNIGFSGIAGPSAVAAGANAAEAADIAQFGAFPLIPASVAVVLGIAAVSPMLSALILPTKDADLSVRGSEADLRRRGAPFFGAESEGLDKRPSPHLASIADIFMGEEKVNADTVDVSRLQNVVITVTLVLGFFSILIAMTTISAAQLIGAKAAIFTTLPELGATFTSLLFVSHATYLVAKAHDVRSPSSSETTEKKSP